MPREKKSWLLNLPIFVANHGKKEKWPHVLSFEVQVTEGAEQTSLITGRTISRSDWDRRRIKRRDQSPANLDLRKSLGIHSISLAPSDFSRHLLRAFVRDKRFLPIKKVRCVGLTGSPLFRDHCADGLTLKDGCNEKFVYFCFYTGSVSAINKNNSIFCLLIWVSEEKNSITLRYNLQRVS